MKSVGTGEINILIGTHAVFSPDIAFSKLGMTIIDEEDKFGVEQKAVLDEHDREGAHHISMTATPIPRSCISFGGASSAAAIRGTAFWLSAGEVGNWTCSVPRPTDSRSRKRISSCEAPVT